MNKLVNQDLEKLTEDILSSYAKDGQTQRIGCMFLPSRSRIVEIVELTRQLLFPGYFGHKLLTAENVRFHVGNLLSKLSGDLTEQINHCLCTERGCTECHDAEKCQADAAGMAHEFLSRVGRMRGSLLLDAQAAYDGDPAAKTISEVVYCYPGFYALTVYRVAHELLEIGVPLMPRIMTEHAHSTTGCDIHPGAKIGRRFFIDHATGVVIGETTHIGDRVKIYQGVTLGALSFPKDERGRVIKGLKRHPTIEDDVIIYANATILGGETVIGKGVTVAANTFITESVTADSLVTHEAPKLQVRSKRHKS
ncbi:MAG TPA: serine acetyltransferase [Phycisphaerales bacterium]|nr:serine acetyltransferase [Phycisphaerales bacterium]